MCYLSLPTLLLLVGLREAVQPCVTEPLFLLLTFDSFLFSSQFPNLRQLPSGWGHGEESDQSRFRASAGSDEPH